MNDFQNGRFDTMALEREARRMQARAMADGARRFGRWMRGALGN